MTLRFTTLTAALALAAACATAPAPATAEAEPAATTEAAAAPTIMPPRCDYGAPNPAAAEELSQFAFLIGDFDITSHILINGDWSPPRPGPHARWNGWYGLDGHAIYDEWYDPDPGLDPTVKGGVNVRIYDPASEEWKMMWVHRGGAQVQDLRAEMRDGKLTMWQVYPERPNFLADFTVEDENHWHRISYTKDEAGNWQPQYKLRATRIPCDEEG